ncbi:hypothetical protein PF004_g10783 [Phytophthora fragariae]|uniref:Uncharacterized protein n=1 Tax=Phytophthora fragariae TaxID=53985 RepID=A0A6G0NZX3_9STRA|nr:hypothetical protein PF004_g10783 [Phytophthora fragariae]
MSVGRGDRKAPVTGFIAQQDAELVPRISTSQNRKRASMSAFKPERFARMGSSVGFQDQDFQRTREKILLLAKEVSDATNTGNDALTARKVLKYRKVTNYRVEHRAALLKIIPRYLRTQRGV